MTPSSVNPAIAQTEAVAQQSIYKITNQVSSGFISDFIVVGIWGAALIGSLNVAIATLAPRWISYQADKLPEPVKVIAYYGLFLRNPITATNNFIDGIRNRMIGEATEVLNYTPLGLAWNAIKSIDFDLSIPEVSQQHLNLVIADVQKAIAAQESSHDYTALNADSGAMGKYQFMPETASRYVDFDGVTEFLNNPEKQDQAFIGYAKDLIQQATQKGYQGCELARAIAAGWYSGDVSLKDDRRPQYSGGNEYPSIATYADQIAAATGCGDTSSYSFPVQGGSIPTAKGALFGDRLHPVHGTWQHHNGVDIAMPTGTPLIAFCDGTLRHYPGADGNGDGFGDSAFFIACNDGLEAWYGHNSSVVVANGAPVQPGDIVGSLGNKGISTGPHLHFEIRKDGQAIDPISYLREVL
ncbi:MAG: M23 family metallopeptidase [Cyanobacteria bacterium P01_E01_bin.6]